MSKGKIIFLGKLPPPYFGPSVWFETLSKSELNDYFNIVWININVHKSLSTVGRFSLLSFYYNLRNYIRFYLEYSKLQPDIIIIPISQSTLGFLKDSIFIKIVSRSTRILIVLHGSNILNWFEKASLITQNYFNSVIRRCTAAIVLGEKLRYLFEPWFTSENIFVIPNGLNIPNETSKRQNTVFTIRYVGNLIRAKGIFNVIESIKILDDIKGEIRLLINGACPDKKYFLECAKLVKENNLPVFFDGILTGKDKQKAYLDSDVFVFTPNKPEGHPIVIIEAMAAGLPIIATNQGAITESVIEGVNGFIVESSNPMQIANRIRYLFDNKPERIRMGEESRKLFELRFTEEVMIKNFRKTIDRILSL